MTKGGTIVDGDNAIGLFDIVGPLHLKTCLLKLESTLRMDGEIEVYRKHKTVREAVDFHRELAQEIHEIH